MPANIEIRINEASFEDVRKKMLSLYTLADEISNKISYISIQVYKPDGVFIATQEDGSQWVMLEDFVTAQQSVQRTAYGTGWLIRLSNFIIGLGWLIASIDARHSKAAT